MRAFCQPLWLCINSNSLGAQILVVLFCVFFFQVYCGSEIRCGIIILGLYLLSPVCNLNLNSYAEELGITKVGINRALKF